MCDGKLAPVIKYLIVSYWRNKKKAEVIHQVFVSTIAENLEEFYLDSGKYLRL